MDLGKDVPRNNGFSGLMKSSFSRARNLLLLYQFFSHKISYLPRRKSVFSLRITIHSTDGWCFRKLAQGSTEEGWIQTKESQDSPTEGEDSPGRGGVGREEVCGEKDFRLGQGQGGVLAPEEHWLESMWQEYLISWTVWLASPAWKWPVWLSTM